MWTNACNKHAFSGATQQFTDTEIADLIKDMIGSSERNAWMMLRDVPKKTVILADPHDSTANL
eukprot:10842589-Karenia_brevis.AAC.1